MLGFIFLAFTLYSVSAGYQWLANRRGRHAHHVGILIINIIALTVHAYVLYRLIDTPQGQYLSFFNMLSMALWLAALLCCLGPRVSHPMQRVVLPLASLSLFPAVLISHTAPLQLAGSHLLLHIMASLLGYSVLMAAAIQALFVALLNRHLHRKQHGFINSLPPLQSMESFLFHMIGLGFALLTLGLIAGIPYVHNLFAQHLAHKTVFSLMAWMVFAGLLFGRYRYGWRGHTAIRWTLYGFILLLFAYFGSKLVLEFIVSP